MSLRVYFFESCINLNGELAPVVHIPCFKLNLIFASRSDNISTTVLTTSMLPFSTARRNDSGKPAANDLYPSYTPFCNLFFRNKYYI